jgi:hypothetical protein
MRGRSSDPSVEELLTRLVRGQEHALGVQLLGTYLFGSAVTGDFDAGISDVDTVAVLRADPGSAQFTALERLHRDIVEETPEWEDRVEAVYLSARALSAFRTTSSPAARISPGEPFHAIEIDHRWLIDWYQLREVGVASSGPPAESLVPPVSHVEFVEAVRQLVLAWPDPADELLTSGDHAYAVLTMCRASRTWRTGEHVSKREAARWACETLPAHADLIRDALIWRARSRDRVQPDGEATREGTKRSVKEVQRLVG